MWKQTPTVYDKAVAVQEWSDADLWRAFCLALGEGRIAVILEDTRNSLDGGTIVTEIDEVIDHIMTS